MAADSDGESSVGFSPQTGCPSTFIQSGTTRSQRTGSNLLWEKTDEETLTDNDLIQTVFTCQGDLGDPDFPKKFSLLLDKLSTLLCTGKEVLMKVKKVEPWNSVRVTLTIPRDAAQRLRTLAQAGDAALQALGILSVQVEGDRLISLRLATRFGGEPQEIVLRTGGETSNTFANNGGSVSVDNSLGHIVSGTTTGAGNAAPAGVFQSPNVVAPSGVGIPPSPKPLAGPPPFPFTSMNHAAQTQQGRDSNNQHNFTAPPPYPTKTYSPSSHKNAPAPSQSPAVSAGKKPVSLSSTNVPVAATSTTKLPASSNLPSYSARDVNSKPFTQKLPPPTGVQPGTVSQLKNVVPPDSVLNNGSSSTSTSSNNMSLSSPLLVNLLQNDGTPVTGAASSSPSSSATNKMAPPNSEQMKTVRKTSLEQSEPGKMDLDNKNYRSNFPNNFNNKMTPKLLANSQGRMPSSVRQRNPGVKAGFPGGQAPGYGGQGPPGSGVPSVPNMNAIRQPGRYGPNLTKGFSQNPLQSVPGSPAGRPNPSSVQRFSQIRAGFPNTEMRPNVLVQGYSQYTASSSKPCSSAETTDKGSEDADGVSDGKKLIINPLTGELEPMPSESSESEEEPYKEDPFLYSSSPASRAFSDDDSTISRRNETSDQSDSEATKSAATEASNPNRRRGASHKTNRDHGPEKIKLRLKLEKSEPITQAYKVDVSFVNSPTPRKPLPVSGNRVPSTSGPSGSTTGGSNNGSNSNNGSPSLVNANNGGNICPPAVSNANSTEEPRVPPLHISLRGPNAAVVVSNRKEKKSPSHWGQLEEEDRFSLDNMNDPSSEFYSKLSKKKVKVSNLKLGREIVAINSSGSELNPKSKKLKLKRVADREVDNILKLKIPVGATVNDVADGLDGAADDKTMLKKRKDSKKQKNNIIGMNKKHLTDLPESDVTKRFDEMVSTVNKRVELNLKMDSEEWISRTLKEETLNYEKRKNCNKLMDDFDRHEKKENESGVGESDSLKSFDVRRSSNENNGSSGAGGGGGVDADEERTRGFKSGAFELSDLLRRKKVGDLNKKVKSLECLKIKGDFVKHKYMELTELADEKDEKSSDEVSVKKPQEIGGKIKSELTSKIDRVSGKLKNDLSVKLPKDGVNKKLKFDDSGLKKLKLDELGKALKKGDKTSLRMKGGKKDPAGLRLASLGNSDGEEDHEGFSRAQKRRHSGDQSITETQTAQKVKCRSSSSDQIGSPSLSKTGGSSRRFDALSRKIRKDSVIDRLRKEKMNKVFALNRKLSTGSDSLNKKQTLNRVAAVKHPVTPSKSSSIESSCPVKETVTNSCEIKQPVVTSLAESDLVKVNKHADGIESPNNPAVGGESPANQGNTQGEDSGIESMDALSEKSPNQGESPCRKEESHSKELEISKPEEKKGQNHDRTEEASKSEGNSCLNKSKSIQNNPTQANPVPLDEPDPRSDSKTDISMDSLNYNTPNSPHSTNNKLEKVEEVGVGTAAESTLTTEEETVAGSKVSDPGGSDPSSQSVASQSEEIRVSSHNRANSQPNDCDESESASAETEKPSVVIVSDKEEEKPSAIEAETDVTNLLMETFETKIREAFLRNENKDFDTTAEGLGAKILETSTRLVEDKEKESGGGSMAGAGIGDSNETTKSSEAEMGSPLLEDIERFRVNPPLYTYAKREDSLSPSPPTVENADLTNNHVKLEQNEEDSNGSGKKRLNKKLKSSEEQEENTSSPSGEVKSNKSLLEQLLIEIPGEDSRKTRSWHRLSGSPGGTPKSSPRSLKDERPLSPSVAKTSPKNASKLSPTPRNKRKLESVDEKGKCESGDARPNKRKCSENAAELIKACMGVDDKKQLLKAVQPVTGNKKGSGEIESSDDEPLIDLAGKGRSREQSVEQEIKKPKLGTEEENRNNNKVSTKNPQGNAVCKSGTEPPTRRSIRQHVKSDSRTVRYTRSAITQESAEVNKRRRTSRDGK